MKILSIISGIVQEVLQGFSFAGSAAYNATTTLTAADKNKHIRCNSATAITLTLPLLSTLIDGDTFTIKNINSGPVTVTVNATNVNTLYAFDVFAGSSFVLSKGESIILAAVNGLVTWIEVSSTNGVQNTGLLASTDLNTVIASGFYRIESTMGNGPTDGSGDFGQLLVMHGSGDTITQILSNYGSSVTPGDVWFRSGNPTDVGGVGTWSQWLKLSPTLGYNGLVAITATTTLTRDTHVGKALYGNSATAFTVTLPAHATLVVGRDVISLTNINKGDMTVTAPTGTIVGEGVSGTYIVLRKGDSVLLVTGGNNFIVVQNGKKGLASKGLGAYTATATLTEADLGRVNYFLHATVAGTLTLPTIASIPLSSVITISNIGVADCTIQRASTDAIYAMGQVAGASVLLKSGDSVTLCNNGSAWADAGSATNAPFTSTTKGLTPASAGGTTNFLRADGTWAAPGGGGGSADYNAYKGIMNIVGAAPVTTLVAADAGKLIRVQNSSFVSAAVLNLPAASSITSFTPMNILIPEGFGECQIVPAIPDTLELANSTGINTWVFESRGLHRIVSDGVSKWILDSASVPFSTLLGLEAGQGVTTLRYNSLTNNIEVMNSTGYQGQARLSSSLAISGIDPYSSISIIPVIGANTAPTVRGGAITAVGTLTAKAIAVTNGYTMANLINYLVTTAATTAIASVRTNIASVFFATTGIRLKTRFAMPTGVIATDRFFCGIMAGVAAPTDVNPSTLLNIAGVGYDAADTNFFFMVNNGAGAATKIDSGCPAPTTNAVDLYTFTMEVEEVTGTVHFGLSDNVQNYTASYTGVKVPATNSIMSFKMYHSVGGVSSVVGLSLGPTTLYNSDAGI